MAKIAIIDDDPDIVDASSLVLQSKGYDVITASNPTDGYKIVMDQNPDLIILDVMMNEPDDGFFLADILFDVFFQFQHDVFPCIIEFFGYGYEIITDVNTFNIRELKESNCKRRPLFCRVNIFKICRSLIYIVINFKRRRLYTTSNNIISTGFRKFGKG